VHDGWGYRGAFAAPVLTLPDALKRKSSQAGAVVLAVSTFGNGDPDHVIPVSVAERAFDVASRIVLGHPFVSATRVAGRVLGEMGMEKLDLALTVAGHDPALFRQFGLADSSAVRVTLRAAAR
jgi:hypothetical protein